MSGELRSTFHFYHSTFKDRYSVGELRSLQSTDLCEDNLTMPSAHAPEATSQGPSLMDVVEVSLVNDHMDSVEWPHSLNCTPDVLSTLDSTQALSLFDQDYVLQLSDDGSLLVLLSSNVTHTELSRYIGILQPHHLMISGAMREPKAIIMYLYSSIVEPCKLTRLGISYYLIMS